jgi:molybdopterin molybdotransferase
LLSIGGISEGTHDLVQDRLLALGVQRVFHGIQLKPGKPTFFGIRERGAMRQYVFGLPGNPASCFTVFELLVRPLLLALQGRARPAGPVFAELAGAGWKPNARLQAIPASVAAGADGRLVATLGGQRTSGDPFGLVAANALVLIPPRAEAKDTRRAEVRSLPASLDTR